MESVQIRRSLMTRMMQIHWPLLAVMCLIIFYGSLLLYDAAGSSLDPYADRQMVRFVFGLGVIFGLAALDVKTIFRLAYPLYGISLVLLILVELKGHTAMGATRWLNIGGFRLQPSEMMKVALILALARYYHMRPLGVVSKIPYLIPPLLMMLVPFILTVKQPDLGTALLLGMMGTGIMFAAGVSWKFFALLIGGGMAAIPVGWEFFLRSYQKQRILTFLDPEADPLGAGYHIMQSKIAIGSAGVWGKGFGGGTQAHLKFLPEKHTDFIFTLMTEDFGMIGALILISLYLLLMFLCLDVALRCRNQFSGLMVIGVVLTVFLYAFINMCMVMGLMPVVGVPLPFVSYGGTALLTLMLGIGLVMNAYVNKDVNLPGAAGLSGVRGGGFIR
ncbi:MAG: rod shape-determining protein RodA [Proteobacteria bacterium]|nr:rod shape-determining protein RodA [Pseudomonadota bacterium]